MEQFPDDLKQEFKKQLQRLVGQPCWNIVSNWGSLVSMDLGGHVLRERPLRALLSDEERLYEGEFRLFLQGIWHLQDQQGEMLADCNDEICDSETMQAGLKTLKAQTIKSIRLLEPEMHLELVFDNDSVLTITPKEFGSSNYTVFFPEKYYTVESDGHIRINS